MNPGIEAVQKLAAMGYRPHLDGENIRLRYEGQGAPDPDRVYPLLAQVKEYKLEVLDYLSKLVPREHIITCYECAHFRPAACSPNPQMHGGFARNGARAGTHVRQAVKP